MEQRLFMRRVRLDPRTRDLVIFAIPNGGRRDAREAALLKAEGVLAGVPDLYCAVPVLGSPGLFLEFKHGTNAPTPQQWLVISRLRTTGYHVDIVRSADDAWHMLCQYLRLQETP